MRNVEFIDTSVFVEFLQVPNLSNPESRVIEELREKIDKGISFVIPITTIIETGNHIAQCSGDRRGAAGRFVRAIQAARKSEPPWIIRKVSWDEEFLDNFMAGVDTQCELIQHLTNKTLGAGDVAILAECDQFRNEMQANVSVWSLDQKLASYNHK